MRILISLFLLSSVFGIDQEFREFEISFEKRHSRIIQECFLSSQNYQAQFSNDQIIKPLTGWKAWLDSYSSFIKNDLIYPAAHQVRRAERNFVLSYLEYY